MEKVRVGASRLAFREKQLGDKNLWRFNRSSALTLRAELARAIRDALAAAAVLVDREFTAE